jgi:hypothetical protein
MAKNQSRQTFAICVANEGCDHLQVWKLYRVLPDAAATAEGYLRVVDDLGKDHLYAANRFAVVDFPPAVEQKILAASTVA